MVWNVLATKGIDSQHERPAPVEQFTLISTYAWTQHGVRVVIPQ